MTALGAIDLPLKGLPFTWSNRRSGSNLIREQLDRDIINARWQVLYPRAGLIHLVVTQSNHCPLLLDTVVDKDQNLRPFCFISA